MHCHALQGRIKVSSALHKLHVGQPDVSDLCRVLMIHCPYLPFGHGIQAGGQNHVSLRWVDHWVFLMGPLARIATLEAEFRARHAMWHIAISNKVTATGHGFSHLEELPLPPGWVSPAGPAAVVLQGAAAHFA